MKYSLLLILVVCLSALPAFPSGKEGGGGNIRRSTPAEINKLLEFGPLDVNSFFEVNEELKPNAPLHIVDPVLAKVFSDIIKMPIAQGIVNDNANLLTVKKLPKGACRDPHHRNRETDVSVWGTPDRAEACLSIERLTRYPISGLKREIAALFFHEFAHIAGYGEDVANRVQEYILSELSRPCYFDAEPSEVASSPYNPTGYVRTTTFRVTLRDVENGITLHGRPKVETMIQVPQQEWNSSDDQGFITMDAYKGSYSFQLSKENSELDFNALNYDGTLSHVHVHVGDLDGSGGAYYIRGSDRGSLVLDGKSVGLNGYGIQFACFNPLD
jgi:hypothetical protein